MICILMLATITSQAQESFVLQSGDFLFQDLDCGDLCEAIEKVTPGIGDRHFSHIGLACYQNGEVYVIESLGKGVQLTPLAKFLQRQTNKEGQPMVMVGRLKPSYTYLIEPAITFSLQQIGTPYDQYFLYDNGKYYCSELIYDAFHHANGAQDFFHMYPMTYKDPETGNYMPAWEQYFQKLGTTIPEGLPGCNPGSIANSPYIDIIFSYY